MAAATGGVEHPPPRLADLLVGDVAHAIVGEVEVLAGLMQEAPSHELLHRVGELTGVDPGRLAQDAELEVAADHGGDAHELARPAPEPLQPLAQNAAHAVGNGELAGEARGAALVEGAHGLDHDQRIAVASPPDPLLQSRIGVDAAPSGEGAHELECLRPGQGEQADLQQSGLARHLGEDAARERYRIELLHARGEHHGDRRAGQAAGQEGGQPEARLVRPVHVLQDDRERALPSQRAQELAHRLEDAQVVVDARARRPGTRADLGEESGELLPPRRAQRLHELHVAEGVAGPQRAHPEAERQDALALVRAALDEPDAVASRFRDDLLDQARLAEPRLAENDHHPRAPFAATVQLGAHARQLGAPADQGRVDDGFAQRRERPRRAPRRRALGRAQGQDLPVELLRLRLRLHPQLAPQRLHAGLVAPQRGRAAPLGRIEPHERAMRGFLQRIEREDAQRGLDGALRLSGRGLPGEQRVEHAQAQLAQPLTLPVEPELEGGILHHEPGEKLASVARRRLLEAFERVRAGQALELEHVHREAAPVERHLLVLDGEAPLPGGTEGAPDLEQGLAKAVAGLLLAPVPPQEAGQSGTGLGMARREGKISHEALGLLRQRQRLIGVLRPEAAQEGQGQVRHHASSPGL